ncbi:ATP synthase subunit beta [Striga asiatica]|uniref:ATP synthase subunit beta n=1 Tax=Striga asiatica TaxID=4170 RepID=A0A5A7P2T3_STRAF|nr:ATP synthase subunit beta [Striga asiatica]
MSDHEVPFVGFADLREKVLGEGNGGRSHFPTFKIESVSLSTATNNKINDNTAVWELGFSVGKLRGTQIKDFNVWPECKPSPEWSEKVVGPNFYMEDKDSGLGNVTWAQFGRLNKPIESKVLDCGVTIRITHSWPCART